VCHKEFKQKFGLDTHVAKSHKPDLDGHEKHSKVTTASSSRQAAGKQRSTRANSSDRNNNHTINSRTEARAPPALKNKEYAIPSEGYKPTAGSTQSFAKNSIRMPATVIHLLGANFPLQEH
jgi:hypothetical protein